MTTDYETLAKNPRAQRMVGPYVDRCDGFRQWMNRSLARVQVYSWRVACRIMPDHPGSIRILKAYRDRSINEWRNVTAAAIRIARRGKIYLPVYSEQLGEYVWKSTPEPLTTEKGKE